MPETTSVAKFLESLRRRETHTTTVLRALFAQPSGWQQDANWPTFRDTPRVLDTLPGWLAGILRNAGLNDAELQHINEWPADCKEDIRQSLVNAIQYNRRVLFFWDLHDGHDSTCQIEVTPGQEIRITFLSPRRNVVQRGVDDIDVRVV